MDELPHHCSKCGIRLIHQGHEDEIHEVSESCHDEIISSYHNTVLNHTNPTDPAEATTIREVLDSIRKQHWKLKELMVMRP